ncbi:MAG TPA: hypothetical protein VM658_17635 [bacterium]|nr:hypothetical protein [bacterium]
MSGGLRLDSRNAGQECPACHDDTVHYFPLPLISYWGSEYENYQFKISAKNNDDVESSCTLSVEEATKAYDAVVELLKIAEHLKMKIVEYDEVSINLNDNIRCGFYQSNNDQYGFMHIGCNSIFLPVIKLNCIVDFINKGFDKIESVLNVNDEA